MARLAVIQNVGQDPNDQLRTVHVNPAHIVSVEGIPGGTRIVLSVGTIYQSKPLLIKWWMLLIKHGRESKQF